MWVENYRFNVAVVFAGSMTCWFAKIHSRIVVGVDGFTEMYRIFEFLL